MQFPPQNFRRHTLLSPVRFVCADGSVHRSTARRPGFTLLEVMISIALVLIIILGVNEVFGLTSRAIGGGLAYSEIGRSVRNAQTIFTNDLSHADIDHGAFFFIRNEGWVGFRNRQDQLTDLDYDAGNTGFVAADRSIRTLDRDGNGSEADPNDLTPRAFLTKRTHRFDQLKFFARNVIHRQTGDVNSFSSLLGSGQELVCYGPLQQPINDGSTATAGMYPGLGLPSGPALTPTTNPNNFYATDWILGRNAFVLRQPDATNRILDPNGNAIFYYGHLQDASMSPIQQDSHATNGSATSSALVQWSQYDVMGTTIESYREILKQYIVGNPSPGWWTKLDYRFTGYPNPPKPLSQYGVARTVPCFIPHCTHFVVEYAGDFLSQNPANGGLQADSFGQTFADGLGHGTDGQVDFNVDAAGKRSIRWYGFPRDTNNNGNIIAGEGDVVPLRDYVGRVLPFERIVLNQAGNYNSDNAVPAGAVYETAWGPDTTNYPRPKLIRITIGVDDPAGRIGGEQFFEFISEVP